MSPCAKARVNEGILDADGDLAILDGIPFTGIGFDPFPVGDGVEYETEYKGGLPHGFKRKWYRAGGLEYEIACRNGLKHGRETHWFPGGSIKLEAVYEFGVKIESRTWGVKGDLISEFKLSPDSVNFVLLQERRIELSGE
jgi:antitoxin component YwqK of YwqJK toxin-antitoxin module